MRLSVCFPFVGPFSLPAGWNVNKIAAIPVTNLDYWIMQGHTPS